MIESKEIRCGNWFEHNANWCYKSPAEIKPFIFQWEESDWFAVGESMMDLDDCSPIPLSPSVLESCGFGQLPHYTVQNSYHISLGRDRFLSVASAGTPNEMVFITEEEAPEVKNIIVARNYDYDGKTFLHHIQNLYYTLTGAELNYQF